MPENILVVEYEPRYTDRVRQALAGQPFTPWFAKDGEEAMRALDGEQPRLIVLSSVVPKVSTPELIRAIRGRKPLAETPILLTVSGYNGKSPRQDAIRMGASDILPKPYSESEFLGKIQQMLGIRSDANVKQWTPELDPEFTVRPSPVPGNGDEGQLTSNEIFGDLLDDRGAAPAGVRKSMKSNDDLDKMLADTLAGVRPQQKKKDGAPPTIPGTVAMPKPAAPNPSADGRARNQNSSADLDKLLNDTLSGLEPRPRPKPVPVAPPAAPTPAPAAPSRPAAPPMPVQSAPAAAPAIAPQPPAPVPQPAPLPVRPAPVAAPAPAVAAAAPYQTARVPALAPEKIPIAQPVFPQAAPAPHEEEEPADGVKFGQYVLLEKIATGGMAEVWKARMRGVEGFQKIVAIKKILPHLSDNQDFVEMFVDEAKLAAQLNHNNIIHIYDLGKIQNSYYIAMEYIDGFDLKTILKRGEERDQPMSVELALFIASKIASALDYAHRKHDFEGKEMSLVHRDVSPQNVLVSQDGDIKLCDFGIAKAASKASHTQAGALKGKLQYMSPEQAWGRNIDKRSDIFALAAVLFEMLTGRKLFTGDNELSILEQVREARVARPSEFNEDSTPEVDHIVRKALEKDPVNRYQTAGEMARDLDAVLYSFKPTPTSADLAIYMHRIWSPEPVMPHHSEPEPEPFVDFKPLPAPVAAAPVPVAAPAAAIASSATPSFGYDEPAKKPPIVPIAIAAVVVIAALIGFFVMRGKGGAPATAPVATATTTTAVTTTQAATTSASPATATTGSAAATQTTALDQSKINEEVAKRLAAERTKLEQQNRSQQATATQAPAAASRPAPVPTATQAVATQAPPPPVQQAPAPVQQAAAPPVETPRPAPVQTQTQAAEAPVARAHEGDVVSGPDTPAHMTRRGTAPYPPMAKAQRIEGTIILSALVSENGQVLEVKILRGINKAVGLNEAAEQIVRRSTFSPPVKDGVHVKAWTTVPVDFKL